jgi:hypothetical protein
MVHWKNPGAQVIATVAGMATVGALTIYLAGGLSSALSIDWGNLALLGTVILGTVLAAVGIWMGALRNRRREG